MNDKENAQDFFKQEVSQYKEEHYGSGYRTFMSVRQERFLEELDTLKLQADAKILDAGCGPGLLTKEIYNRGFGTYAIDTSPDMLNLTREHFSDIAEDLQPNIGEGNVEDLPFDDETFDVVISPGVIEYLENDTRILTDFHRVLKPGGYFILSVTNQLSPIGYFEFLIEAIKRTNWTRNICNFILQKLGRTSVRARTFKVRKHFPWNFRKSILRANFSIIGDGYFYVLPWPHPADRIFPNASDSLGKLLEPLSKSIIKPVAEGYYVVGQKHK